LRIPLKEGIGGESMPKDRVKTGCRQGDFTDNSGGIRRILHNPWFGDPLTTPGI